MKILLKQAKIVDKNSPFNGTTKDILIENGKISSIEDVLDVKADQIIDHKNLHVSIGWCDFRVSTQDPGNEHKESIETALNAAKHGGFTSICTTASTQPTINSKSDIQYILNASEHHLVDVYPFANLSEQQNGENISEMFDLQSAGAAAFSDNKQSVQDAGLMSRALLYAKNFDGLVINFPKDKALSNKGIVNESVETTKIGLKGNPSLSEMVMVNRDIYLADYHNTKLHIGPISCKESVDLIREAKNKGINISCEVAIHNLIFTDEDVATFDSNFKVNPPYRTKEDRAALINGVIEGVIDVISSDHSPEDTECKDLEFEYANDGIIGLQTLFSLANELFSDQLTLDELVLKISANPRTILKKDTPVINEGFEANLTLFDPTLEWEFTEDENQSKSNNSPFFNSTLTGKSIGVINNGRLFINA